MADCDTSCSGNSVAVCKCCCMACVWTDVPCVVAVVLEIWVLCYYHRPPEKFWPSGLPHGVLKL